MRNKQKEAKIYKTIITSPDTAKPVSPEPAGNADDIPSCVYNHQWHAEGSEFESRNGVKMICDSDGEWKNIRQETEQKKQQ